MKKALGLAYGLLAYLVFLAVFLYLVGFVGDVGVPKSMDSGTPPSLVVAAAVDVGLLLLFSLQHSVMARRGFKEWWTRIVPPHLERSTYVLVASLVLAGVMAGWQPIPVTVWKVEAAPWTWALWGLFGLGWGIVLLSTFLIDHLRLFGLTQVWSHLRGRRPDRPDFQTPGLYRWVRHPLYLGFLLAFWATPHMTVGHLLFAGVWTSWILLAIRLEERDLVRVHGEAYRAYRRRVPMLLPRPAASSGGARTVDGREPREEPSGA